MISCQYKNVFFATNIGAMVEMCNHLGVFVTDSICSGCTAREGETGYVPDFGPQDLRPEDEIHKIEQVCFDCPLFNRDTARCKKRANLQRQS